MDLEKNSLYGENDTIYEIGGMLWITICIQELKQTIKRPRVDWLMTPLFLFSGGRVCGLFGVMSAT